MAKTSSSPATGTRSAGRSCREMWRDSPAAARETVRADSSCRLAIASPQDEFFSASPCSAPQPSCRYAVYPVGPLLIEFQYIRASSTYSVPVFGLTHVTSGTRREPSFPTLAGSQYLYSFFTSTIPQSLSMHGWLVRGAMHWRRCTRVHDGTARRSGALRCLASGMRCSS